MKSLPCGSVMSETNPSGPALANTFWPHLAHTTLLPFGVAAGLLAVLEIVLVIGAVPSYVLPRPSLIGATLVANADLLARHAWVTIVEATLGFVAGESGRHRDCGSISHSRRVERSLFPIAQIIRSIPVVAPAPLFLLWFGNGITPKVMTAALDLAFS